MPAQSKLVAHIGFGKWVSWVEFDLLPLNLNGISNCKQGQTRIGWYKVSRSISVIKILTRNKTLQQISTVSHFRHVNMPWIGWLAQNSKVDFQADSSYLPSLTKEDMPTWISSFYEHIGGVRPEAEFIWVPVSNCCCQHTMEFEKFARNITIVNPALWIYIQYVKCKMCRQFVCHFLHALHCIALH